MLVVGRRCDRPVAPRARIRSCRAVRPAPDIHLNGRAVMRIVGLHVSRSVAEIAYLEDGVLHAGRSCRTKTRRTGAFCGKVAQRRSCGARSDWQYRRHRELLRPHVERVAIANALLVRLIVGAHVQTDKINASVLARLYASNFLRKSGCPTRSPSRYTDRYRAGHNSCGNSRG